MESTPNAPRSLIISIRLYQALLAVYPSEFRQEYSGPMLQVFRDCARQALRETGASGLLPLWGRTLLDTVQTALEEYSHRGVDMSREKFFKLSGWAMILGPIVFLLGALAASRPPYVSYAMSSLPIDRYANVAAMPLLVTGMVFMILGLLGFLLRYSPHLDGAGLLLGISALAGLPSVLGAIMMALTDGDSGWYLFMWGIPIQLTALAGFGILNLRRRLLPRWNGLPLLGFSVPVLWVLSSGLVRLELGPEAFFFLWILVIVMFAGLGYLLQSGAQTIRTTAAAV